MTLALVIMDHQEPDNKGQDRLTKSPSDFSIDHILNRAGSSKKHDCNDSAESGSCSESSVISLPWLQCTRYFPPKIPKNHRRDGPQKRQLGRHPRIPFTSHQLSILEAKYQESPYLSSDEVTFLSQQLQLADIRVKIWFQNRRARERREKNSPTPKDSPNDQETSRSPPPSPPNYSGYLITPFQNYLQHLPPS